MDLAVFPPRIFIASGAPSRPRMEQRRFFYENDGNAFPGEFYPGHKLVLENDNGGYSGS